MFFDDDDDDDDDDENQCGSAQVLCSLYDTV